MLKKFLLCAAVLLLSVSPAFTAEPSYLWGYHSSLAGVTDGRADYSNARFYRVFLNVQQDNVELTDEYSNAEGTFTLAGGKYSVVKDTKLEKISGTEKTFTLKIEPDTNHPEYTPVYDYDREEVSFLQDADDGLNGVTVTWNFPTLPGLNGQGKVPTFRTTQQQLNNFVPYFEHIRYTNTFFCDMFYKVQTIR